MLLLCAALAALVLVLPAVATAGGGNPAPPGASTGSATAVTRTTATLTASVDPNGAATTYRFEYGTSTSYGLSTAEPSAGAGGVAVTVSVPLTGLTADTTYHYRVVATNAAGVSRGGDRTLRTAPPPRAPGVSTGGAKEVQPTTATLTGTVTPFGQATTYRFEWGTSTRYGRRTATASAGDGTKGVPARVTIAGLTANMRYHVRLVATNATGTTRGRDRTFTTLRGPTGLGISASPSPVVWGRSTTISGRLGGSGVGGATVALERLDFPFGAPWRGLTTRKTNSRGEFRFTGVGPLWAATRLRVVSRTTIAVASPVVEVAARVRVGVRRGRTTRRRVRLSGTINPGLARARISVQRLTRRGMWRRVKRVRPRVLNANAARYRVGLARTRRTTRVRVVVLPRDGGAHVRGVSRELRLRGRG